jgi:hypothetical protein
MKYFLALLFALALPTAALAVVAGGNGNGNTGGDVRGMG